MDTGLLLDFVFILAKRKQDTKIKLARYYLVELSAQEEEATSIRDAGFDPNNDDDILAYYISNATGAKG